MTSGLVDSGLKFVVAAFVMARPFRFVVVDDFMIK
jgi:hypothetical protein